MTRRPNKLIPVDFSAVPSARTTAEVRVDDDVAGLEAVGHAVRPGAEVPTALGISRSVLERAGFEGKVGDVLVLPAGEGPVRVAVGVGPAAEQSVASLRDAAAAFARAMARTAAIGLVLPELGRVDARLAGQAVAEGALLARYRYNALRRQPKDTALAELRVVCQSDFPAGGVEVDEVAAGAAAGAVTARAAAVARDLANTPAGHLTATDLAEVAAELGRAHGFEVEAFDKQQLIEMGCGGLLGVNMGSVEEPRLVKLSYVPGDGTDGQADGQADGHLAMVGKGITYDSGGISLKPSDPMHLLMKMDMGGAAAVLGAFTGLRDLGVRTTVTGYLSCTDNMPSGTAYMLGDVLRIRGGTTVEVKNTDAEGRLVMADAIVLAKEEPVSAIVDVATLTGAALTSLGPSLAALIGNHDGMLEQLEEASAATDERVWQLPLEKRYRKLLDSEIADISNLGGPHAGTITAALFLAEFVGDTPWAHVDIAGTMQVDADESWRSKGATGFGARLLLEVARAFRVPASADPA